MDLFGRKANLAREVAEAQLDMAVAWISDLQSRLDEAYHKLEIQQGALDRFADVIHKQTTKVRGLEVALSAMPKRSEFPLYKSEEEEELEFALRNGDIDLGQFKDLMQEQGFENAEVEIPERPERPIIY